MNEWPPEYSEVRFGNKTIAYKIHRSAKRSTVSIAIDPTEGVLVTAPRPAPVKRLDDIVHAKASWIIDRLKKRSDLPPPPARKEFVSGETFLYLGRQYRLRIVADTAPQPLRLEAGWLRLNVPSTVGVDHRSGYARVALIDWYGRQAVRCLPERAAKLARKIGVAPSEVIVNQPMKRWGSASSSGVVRFNWRVVQAPISTIEYVLVHELVHLTHPDHSRRFWETVGRLMPDYEIRRARLRELGPLLEW